MSSFKGVFRESSSCGERVFGIGEWVLGNVMSMPVFVNERGSRQRATEMLKGNTRWMDNGDVAELGKLIGLLSQSRV